MSKPCYLSNERPHAMTLTPSGSPIGSNISGLNICLNCQLQPISSIRHGNCKQKNNDYSTAKQIMRLTSKKKRSTMTWKFPCLVQYKGCMQAWTAALTCLRTRWKKSFLNCIYKTGGTVHQWIWKGIKVYCTNKNWKSLFCYHLHPSRSARCFWLHAS
jgi:hypothetical protein